MFSSNTSAANGAANYIEDVFSTWLYTGNGTTQTITNGIDLTGKGGLVWAKSRTEIYSHILADTLRGAGNILGSNTTNASTLNTATISSFSSSGFSLGNNVAVNNSGQNFVSWAFREQPKFFDVVTYTGTGANRTIAHSLGSVPGCIIVKRTNTAGAWNVYHRSLGNAQNIELNSAVAAVANTTIWNSTTPTSTEFSLGPDTTVNSSGSTYVAYVFAHDAGGFGLTGTDNVISCGSFTTDGSGNATINLGYEPQWAIVKLSSASGGWCMVDSMRGNTTLNGATNTEQLLLANSSAAESSTYGVANPTSTGFQAAGWPAGATLIYIAIRRGPMKTPISGTSVFSPIAVNVAAGTAQTTGFVVDSQWKALRTSVDTLNSAVDDRLRGVSIDTTTASGRYVITSATAAEATANATTFGWNNTGFLVASYYSSKSSVFWNFGRAPGFMDIVCYTGTGANRTVAHNLAAAPELMIVKRRSAASNWPTYTPGQTAGQLMLFNSTGGRYTDANYFSSLPTSASFSVGSGVDINASGGTYVAYLFASCPGVSKVGSYTGTGTTQQINCGFAAGARFVLIKRTDSTGDWYVWDSARGIVAGNDPYLLLNNTAAEVTSTDYIDTFSSGFEISSTAPAAINASGGTYIFLAIA